MRDRENGMAWNKASASASASASAEWNGTERDGNEMKCGSREDRLAAREGMVGEEHGIYTAKMKGRKTIDSTRQKRSKYIEVISFQTSLM